MSLAIIGVGVGTAAIGAGATMYANKQQQKATQAAMGQAGQAYGSIPQHAAYNPVDFDQAQLMAILANANAMPAIEGLMFRGNSAVTSDALRRAKKLIPGYKNSMKTYGQAGTNLLNGRLPYSDVMGIAGDRAELANSLGTPGAAGPATLKDLGLSHLDAIKAGGGILKDMVGIAETISPISRNMTPQSMMMTPQQRIALEMEQNQLMQQNQQSAYNLDASGDPAAYAQMQLQLAQAGQDAAATRSYGDAASQLLGTVGGAYQQRQRPPGGYSTNTGNYYPAGSWQNSYLGASGQRRPAYYNGYIR